MSTAQNQPLTAEERAEMELWVITLDVTTSISVPPPRLDEWASNGSMTFDAWADFCSSWDHEAQAALQERDLLRLSALRKMLEWAEQEKAS